MFAFGCDVPHAFVFSFIFAVILDKVLNKLLSSTSTGNPNYRADIDYFDKLVKDEKSLVKTVEEAEDVIAGIPVYIKASLAI